MKIKCPYCKKEYDVKTWLDIATHDEEVCNIVEILPNKGDYYSLLFKIHEKIEEYKGKDCRDDPSVSVEHLLTSLLEDDLPAMTAYDQLGLNK